MNINGIEKRFLDVTGISCDLTKFPLHENDIKNNILIDKEKSDEFGEVFTPLWLVDKMILKAGVKKLHQSKSSLDLCAGYGQFTIRMIRALNNYDKDFNVLNWLKENHTFIEIQLESVYKILYIFGIDINLLIGDALQLDIVRKWDGINYLDGYWKPIPKEWVENEILNGDQTFIRKFLEKFKTKPIPPLFC